MRFETKFVVPGHPSQVIEQFSDAPLMASYLPGASVGTANPDGSYPGSLVVTFGPKRITFKGTITNQVDSANLSGLLTARASADIRSAKMALKMTYTLSEVLCSTPVRTEVSIVSEAQLTGVLADFARTGGVHVTNTLLTEFARRFSVDSERKSPPSAEPAPLSFATLMAGAIRGWWGVVRSSISKAPEKSDRRK